MRRKQRRIRAATIAVTGMLIMSLHPVPVQAAEVTSQDLQQIQEGVLSWKNSGETKLLSGELLDGAGTSQSDWYAFDVSRMGLEQKQDAYLSRLQDAVSKIYEDLDNSIKTMKVTDWSRIALTASACGADPTDFGTDHNGNSINLIEDGTWNCIFEDPGKQGLNGYIWSLMTMDSKNYEVPEDAKWTREKLVDIILDSQKEDGGFGLQKDEASDVDMTAMALTALSPYEEKAGEAAEEAFAYLSSVQQQDGTMITGKERTSESTGWTMIALCSWNRSPFTDEAFIKNGNSLYDGYQLFFMENGSVIHSLDGVEKEEDGNSMSGYQAVYALEACIRQMEGKNHLFDLTDAQPISKEKIKEAGGGLPELKEETEKDKEEAIQDTQNRSLVLTSVLVGIIALIIVVLVISLVKKNAKRQKTSKEDEDEW